jgi:hypothetical protein
LEDLTMSLNPSPNVPPVNTIAEGLRLLGFEPGAPSHITEDTQAIDRRLCAALVCGSCRRRGTMTYQPFRRGASYRAIAVCQRCGEVEEI